MEEKLLFTLPRLVAWLRRAWRRKRWKPFKHWLLFTWEKKCFTFVISYSDVDDISSFSSCAAVCWIPTFSRLPAFVNRTLNLRESDFAATHSCNDYDDCCDCDCSHLIRHWHESSHSSRPHSAPSWWWQSELDLFAEASMALDNPSTSDNIFWCMFVVCRERCEKRRDFSER